MNYTMPFMQGMPASANVANGLNRVAPLIISEKRAKGEATPWTISKRFVLNVIIRSIFNVANPFHNFNHSLCGHQAEGGDVKKLIVLLLLLTGCANPSYWKPSCWTHAANVASMALEDNFIQVLRSPD